MFSRTLYWREKGNIVSEDIGLSGQEQLNKGQS